MGRKERIYPRIKLECSVIAGKAPSSKFRTHGTQQRNPFLLLMVEILQSGPIFLKLLAQSFSPQDGMVRTGMLTAFYPLHLKKVLLGLGAGVLALSVLLLFWWRSSVGEKVGLCKTPIETCVNREGIPIGSQCEC